MADLKMEANPRFQKHGIPDSIRLSQLQNLLHEALIATNHVQNCAIISRHKGTLMASSSGFKLLPDQIQILLGIFRSPQRAPQKGFHFDSVSYQCIRADRSSVYAKSDNGGLVMTQTETLVLMAVYSDGMYPSVCVEAVEKLADYFREKGK